MIEALKAILTPIRQERRPSAEAKKARAAGSAISKALLRNSFLGTQKELKFKTFDGLSLFRWLPV
jgi:hypothetical protein